jgi:hypothetical protein
MDIRICRVLAASLAVVTWTGTAEAQEAGPSTSRLAMAASRAQAPVAEASDSTQRDSSLDGLLIGAAVGAIPGIYYLITDPNECTGMCPEEYGLIAAGAAIGWLIDRAITRKATAARAGDRASVSLVAYGAGARKGVRVAIRF